MISLQLILVASIIALQTTVIPGLLYPATPVPWYRSPVKRQSLVKYHMIPGAYVNYVKGMVGGGVCGGEGIFYLEASRSILPTILKTVRLVCLVR